MPRTLLIADDAAIIREMIKDTATEAGWQVVGEATDGREAVDRYRELRPDACTLDLVMPGYNGLHALRGITGIDPDAAILVVSALEQQSILKEAFRAGASDFLVKPFAKQVLIETLDRLVPKRRDVSTAFPKSVGGESAGNSGK
jgi:two-component system chemotaxis response regulator CheY